MTPPENSLGPLARWAGEQIISLLGPTGKMKKEEEERKGHIPSPPSSPESYLRKPATTTNHQSRPSNTQTRPANARRLSRKTPFIPKSAASEAADVFAPISQPTPRREPDIDKLPKKHTDLFPDSFAATQTELSQSVQVRAGREIEDAMVSNQFLSERRQNKQQLPPIPQEENDASWIHITAPSPIPIPPRILPSSFRNAQIRASGSSNGAPRTQGSSSHDKELEHLLGHMHNLKLSQKRKSRKRRKEEKEVQRAEEDNEENDYIGDMFHPSVPSALIQRPRREKGSSSLPPPNSKEERGRTRHRKDSVPDIESRGSSLDAEAEEGMMAPLKKRKKRGPPKLQPHGPRNIDENGMMNLMAAPVIITRQLGQGGKVKDAPAGKIYGTYTTPETELSARILEGEKVEEGKRGSEPSSWNSNKTEEEVEEEKIPWTSQGRLERMRRLGPLNTYSSSEDEEAMPF